MTIGVAPNPGRPRTSVMKSMPLNSGMF